MEVEFENFEEMDFEDKVRKVFEDYDNGLPRDQAIAKIVEIHLRSVLKPIEEEITLLGEKSGKSEGLRILKRELKKEAKE